MRIIFVFLIILVLLNEVFNIYFHIVEITVLLYYFYYVCYIEIFIFFKFVIFSNIISYLFCEHIKFFF